MSEESLPKKTKAIYYGSFAEKERERLTGIGPGISGIADVGISRDAAERKTVDIDDASVNVQKKQVLEEFDRKRKARQLAVAVDDGEIRAQLRSLNEPMCLFGEGPADRRQRLRDLLSRSGQEYFKKKEDEEKVEDKSNATTWYHEGTESLRQARLFIASFSIPRAAERLNNSRMEKEIPQATKISMKNEIEKNLRSMEIACSQVADSQQASSATFSPDHSMIATSSFSGLCRLWSVPDLQPIHNLRGHNMKASHITFHPASTISQSKSSINLASSGFDGSVFLWNLESEEPIHSLDGHAPHRVSRIAFHPSGKFLATACHDKSWRLWDLEKLEEVLYQEGHSKAVFDICFQSDGSLAASGGMDAFGRVWDLRTGRCIMFMEGHLEGIVSINIAPNGYHIVTGSEDHSVKIWNVRQRRLEYTIPAHTSVVSGVLFDKQNSKFIATCSFDKTVKFWAHPGWNPIHSVMGHDNMIRGLDLTTDSKFMVTASRDKTFKLWTPDPLGLI